MNMSTTERFENLLRLRVYLGWTRQRQFDDVNHNALFLEHMFINRGIHTGVIMLIQKRRRHSDVVRIDPKPPVPLGRTFFRLFTIEINSAIANNLKTIGMMKMQRVTIYRNIYECVSDYNYEDSSRPFLNILRTLCERT